MTNIGKICYKSGDGRPACKAGGSAPVFKADAGSWTKISFAWGSDGKDLDICAYWDGANSMKVGYNHNTATSEQTSGPYHIFYSGDERGTDTSEWVRIKMSPWSGAVRTFKVHFNFYGYVSSTYPANTCAVVATQENGPSRVLVSVPCSTRHGQAAATSDPGVKLTFSADGTLQSMEVI